MMMRMRSSMRTTAPQTGATIHSRSMPTLSRSDVTTSSVSSSVVSASEKGDDVYFYRQATNISYLSR